MGFKLEVNIEELAKKRKLFIATPMYGGQCAGMYARSMMELTNLLTRMNIAHQPYFLFNESLITRARNYCCDEFMRSDCTHMLFIDSDIGFNANDIIAILAMMEDDSDYDIMGGPYPKKSYDKNTLVSTKDGLKKIGDIVDNEWYCDVLSLNTQTNKFEWKPIISHSRFPSNGKRWVSVQATNQKALVVTEDHELAVIRDVLNPKVTWLEAKDCDGLYVARKPNRREGTNNENHFYNEDQLQCLIGTLLGDGSIDIKGYLKFGHSVNQKDYLRFKQELFGGKISEQKMIGEYKGTEYHAEYLWCPRNAQVTRLGELLTSQKTLKNVLHMVDERALAMWYMDDGSLTNNHQQGHHVMLCTDNYQYDEVESIVDMLATKFGISSSINKCGNGWRVRIAQVSVNDFFKLIAPYVIKSMEYKMPSEHCGGEKYEYDFTPMDICAKKVSVQPHDTNSDQYDIGVADNFNFVANHYVSHNCISWEKVKAAVDKGFADDDPNELEKFVGDFVFNPKAGGERIPIGEPVEVLEIGTGFMMIKRKCFEVMNKKFPELLYKPDHVRTEHFDGTREIMMYFQAAIDAPNKDRLIEKMRNAKSESEIHDIMKEYDDSKAKTSKRYLSEDYWFCQRVQEAGLQTWLCPWMKTFHVGTYIFGGSLPDLAAVGVAATADAGIIQKNREKKKRRENK